MKVLMQKGNSTTKRRKLFVTKKVVGLVIERLSEQIVYILVLYSRPSAMYKLCQSGQVRHT